MTSKYAEDIAEIKTDMKHVLGHLEKLNASQGKQWSQINENEGNIKVLDSKVKGVANVRVANISARGYVLAAAVAGASAIIGGLVSSWF